MKEAGLIRKTVLSLTLFLFATVVCAQRISVERARTLAGGNVRLAYTAVSDGRADFYAFNRQDNKGFVIVAADEAVGGNMILAYSDNGAFDYERLPESAKWWLSLYQNEIDSLRKTSGMVAEPVSHPAVPVVAPLLGDVIWDQYYPYNILSPSYSGKKTPAGCAAVSMAQIMYYYKWPLVGKGEHSYMHSGKKYSVRFSDSKYEWSKILPKYVKGFYSEEQANAVAKLIYDCGVSINMAFDVDGSAAATTDVLSALRNYFSYKTPRLIYRENFRGDWTEFIKKELINKRPVYYCGRDNSGGHAFVCDGFDSNDYFHFNFGWNGEGNGYFLLSVAGGFSDSQHVICGIEPDRSEVSAGGLSYSILNDGQVEVTGCPDGYSGNVVIPSFVTLDDSVYKVTRISSNAFTGTDITSVVIPESVEIINGSAFFGCDSLNSVVLENPEPQTLYADLFSADTYSFATLSVPEGSLEKYSVTTPWCFFSTISDGREQYVWNPWRPDGDGTGVYTFGWDTVYAPLRDLPVYVRESVDNPGKCQYKIDNWLNTSLLINVDLATGECLVPFQLTGNIYYDSELLVNTSELAVMDTKTFRKSADEENLSYFDEDTGTFTIRMSYIASDRYGYYSLTTDTFRIDGYPSHTDGVETVQPDYSDDVIYNLAGQRLSSPQRGINIINGRKVLVSDR